MYYIEKRLLRPYESINSSTHEFHFSSLCYWRRMLLSSETTTRLKIYYIEKRLFQPYGRMNNLIQIPFFSVSLLLAKNAVAVRDNDEAENILYQKTNILTS